MPEFGRPTQSTRDVVAVLNPWGRTGSYGGPVVLSRVLFSALHERHGTTLWQLAWEGSSNGNPNWAAVTINAPSAFGRLGTGGDLLWGIWQGLHLRRHRARIATVHLHGVYLPNLVALAVSGLKGSRVVLLPVLERGDLTSNQRVKRRLLRFAAQRTSVAFALSSGIMTELRAIGVPARQIERIANPVPLEDFKTQHPRVSQAGDGSRSIRIAFVGKLGPVKQPDLVIDAVAELRERGINATAVLIGPAVDGSYQKMLDARIASLGLENSVTRTGFLANVAPILLDGVDVFVLPSTAEGMPGALAEAMVAGLPSLVTDVGAMREHVEGARAGYVVEPTVDSLVTRLEHLAADSDLRHELSANAAAYGRRVFGSQAVADAYHARTHPHQSQPSPTRDGTTT